MTHEYNFGLVKIQNSVCPGFDWFAVSARFNVWTIILRLWRLVRLNFAEAKWIM